MNTKQHLRNPMVVEEATKKAEPQAKQLGLASIPDDMLEMICPNLTYARQFTPELYAKFQNVKRLLKELSEQSTPKHGHIVKFTTQYASYDESVLLLREGEIRGENLIACVGGKNLDDLDLRDYGTTGLRCTLAAAAHLSQSQVCKFGSCLSSTCLRRPTTSGVRHLAVTG
ncbi:hypothetical protein VTH8203_04605 [Vibrio thalassae]|uniref:Uncharacterized protein n=1 Tax=Vibrio thalassae TaxID=1243014 RepID=A0A240ERE8_9VIBR|nr:hypothetical protein [Vibrio thalassae]SNX50929.1 hypothetical protein VTH8203_04605 [Vibrio thalassae]